MQGIKVLDLGGDEYITPSTNMMVMMVKVVAIMRRVSLVNRRSDEGPIHCGELVINPGTFEVYLGATGLRLTLCSMAARPIRLERRTSSWKNAGSLCSRSGSKLFEGEVDSSVSEVTRSGFATAASCAIIPPCDRPTR